MTQPSAQTTATPEARNEIDRLIAAGDVASARQKLRALWRASPTSAIAGFVNARAEKLRDATPMAACRAYVLRSFTVEPIVPLMRAEAWNAGIDLSVRIGDFGTYTQEVLDPASALYAEPFDVVFLAVQARDIAPDLVDGFMDMDMTGVDAVVKRVCNAYASLAEQFRRNSATRLVIHLLERPEPAAGVLDPKLLAGQIAAIDRINQSIRETARRHTGVYCLDYDGLVARHGRGRWFDARRWLTARLPIAADHLIDLAREWMRFVHPASGRLCKAVCVDLDNTLWGGVIGEDGIDGIKLDNAWPGQAFRDVQRTLLDLYRRGVLLAVCSKNNPAEAMEAIEKHPGMLLRAKHFAAVRTNWNDKASNLREIAAELNIGIDALAFLDDNPVEREWVRGQLPDVTIIDLPADPMGYAAALARSPVFERLEISEEDRRRGEMYAEQRQRTELQQNAGSLEDFYRSLRMTAQIARVTPATLGRAAQLTQKTNQFNLTTRRYNEQQLSALIESGAADAFTIAVQDSFGDNGIVGMAIVRYAGAIAEIDTFLLSCRVIGRTVETAFLATLHEAAAARGMTEMLGRFLPTAKNAPCRDFYASHGYKLAKNSDGGGSDWSRSLVAEKLAAPEWIVRELNLMTL